MVDEKVGTFKELQRENTLKIRRYNLELNYVVISGVSTQNHHNGSKGSKAAVTKSQ